MSPVTYLPVKVCDPWATSNAFVWLSWAVLGGAAAISNGHGANYLQRARRPKHCSPAAKSCLMVDECASAHVCGKTDLVYVDAQRIDRN